MNLREQTRRLSRESKHRRGDHLEDARWHMRVWAEWHWTQRQRGWPRESNEVRASQSKQAQTRLNKQARWRGKGTPPPMPKETRPSGQSRIPDIDKARIGPHVDRLLLDLTESGGTVLVTVLQSEYLDRSTEDGLRRSQSARAARLGLSLSKYQNRLREGLAWLSGRLAWVPLERVQAEREVSRETSCY